MIRASIVGGAGYAGGELTRILLQHPDVELSQVTSSTSTGTPVHQVHPNLRGFTQLRYIAPDQLQPADVLFLALGHGRALADMARYRALAPLVIDLSADMRLHDAAAHMRWYGDAGARPLSVYGLPELHRSEMKGASLVSGPGCSAAATILALRPLVGRFALEGPVVVQAMFGSSAAGAEPGASSHHPERAGSVRQFQPHAHRHAAEVAQELGLCEEQLSYAGVAVEMVRGVSVSMQCRLAEPVTDRDLRGAFLDTYRDEPFVRVVADRRGLHRSPDPRILAGTNLCDVGFAVDSTGRRAHLMAALDNLGKGAAGGAVQCMNVALGLDERAGLAFAGLHP